MSNTGNYKSTLSQIPEQLLKDLIKELESIKKTEVESYHLSSDTSVSGGINTGVFIDEDDLQAIIDKYKPLAL